MGVFAIENRALRALDAEDQRMLRDVMGEVMRDIDAASREDNRRAAEVMTNAGVQVVTVNDTDIGTLRSTIETIYPELRRRPDVDAAMLDELLAVLAEYRRAHPRVPTHSN
jgi:TRAP-type C4-dicarboxylate transport system substrate-binding protein